MIRRTRRAVFASLMAGAMVAVGYSLAAVPNVELVSVTAFLSGFLLGPALGAATGAAGWGAYSLFNPMGAAVAPVFAAQITVAALVGASGGVLGPAIRRVRVVPLAGVLGAACGLLLTLVYQGAVNAAAYWAFGAARGGQTFWAYLVAGVVFSSTHLIWNTAVFGVILRPMLVVLEPTRLELNR